MRFYLITIIYYDQRRHVIEEETLTGHKKIGSKDARRHTKGSAPFSMSCSLKVFPDIPSNKFVIEFIGHKPIFKYCAFGWPCKIIYIVTMSLQQIYLNQQNVWAVLFFLPRHPISFRFQIHGECVEGETFSWTKSRAT